MKIDLAFLGAARNVTGSQYLIQANAKRILVDCGLYQERELKVRNWEPFFAEPDTIDAVVLTHAHLDHCGLVPKLVHEGFTGRIHCTEATADIAGIVLLDSAKIQEEDTEFKLSRHKREGRKGPYPVVPLYSAQDVEETINRLNPVSYGKNVELGDGINITFHDAGHILGSSMLRMEISNGAEARTLVFSGDVGRWDRAILRDPTVFEHADYVVVESTYGDRLHEDAGNVGELLADVINKTRARNGNIIIPSFAIERSQEIMYHLNELLISGKIPHLMVFVDSPMAVGVTDVFKRHPELFDEEMRELLNNRKSPFDFPGLKMVRTVNESKAINHIKGTIVILAGSGMCTGGRIKHHLANSISRSENTILFVGYQATGTLGRQITDGTGEVRILGELYPVRAQIAEIHGFSGHADKNELLKWLRGFRNKPRQLFVTHGEPEVAGYFANLVQESLGFKTSVPDFKESVVLD